MGFFDNISNSVSRGQAGMERNSEKRKLQNQMEDIIKRRQQLTNQLGANLYDVTKNDPTFRTGRETLYDGIASCDDEKKRILDRIAVLDAQEAASVLIPCPHCGAQVAAGDVFCSTCGQSVQVAPKPQPADPNARRCPKCGEVAEDDALFCMGCGTRLPEKTEEADTEKIESVADPYEPQTPEPATAQPEANKCIKCGQPLEEGDLFCAHCGTKQE